MNNKINSLSRIHDILLSLDGVLTQSAVVDVWSQAFELTSIEGVKRVSLVSEKLILLLDEVELAENKLALNYPSKTYNSMVGNLNNAFSPMLLGTTWGSVKQYLAPDVMMAIQILRETLPNEEELIKPEELNELHARLSELETFLEKSVLPERVVGLIKRHIKLIREALSNFSITGAKGLVEARRASYGEFFEVKEILQSKDKHEISELKAIWEMVNKITDGALKVYGLYELSKETVPLLENFI
ncbi:MAG: hypothetical protein ACXW1T_00780 [Methylophilus sp.]